jgi:hypothetical protein
MTCKNAVGELPKSVVDRARRLPETAKIRMHLKMLAQLF